MPFKALVDKIDQMDLTRTITNNHKRLYEINQTTNNINDDLKQMNIAGNNINDLSRNDLEQFEGTIFNVLNGIRQIIKETVIRITNITKKYKLQ